jgi:membrane peptidoglycan carboxypeptidase
MNAPDTAKTGYIVDPGSDAACPGTHFYCPTNAAKEAGTYTMWGAFGKSVNTFFVPLQEKVGAQKVVDVAKRLGMKFRSDSDARYAANANQWGAFTLGVSASTPLDMAGAWAALAADGRYCEPTPVLEIVDRDGNKIDAANPRCTNAVAPNVARAAMDAARCPVGDHSATTKCVGATAGGLRGIVGKPLAGKTGTTDGDNSATMTITTKQLAISGYIVDPDWPMHPSIGDHGIINNAVAYAMRDVLRGQSAIDFTPPSPVIVHGTKRR